MATTALLFLLAGTSTTQALDARDAKNLTSIGYIYTYPIMLTYRQMYADVLAKGPPYNFNQFVIQDKLPDFKVGLCVPCLFPPPHTLPLPSLPPSFSPLFMHPNRSLTHLFAYNLTPTP